MELTAAQINQALIILRREEISLSLSPLQRRLYWALCCSTVLAAAGFASFVALTRIENLRNHWVVSVILFTAIAATFAATTLFVLSLPALVRKTWRHIRLVRKLGLEEVATMRRRSSERRGRVASTVTDGTAILGACAVMLLMIGLHDLVTTVIGAALVVVVVFVVAIRRMRSELATTEDIERLKRSLTEYKAIAPPSGSPPESIVEAVDEIARMERAQISDQRARAIERQNAQADEYAVLKSTAVIATLADIDVAHRLRVEECLDQIAAAWAADADSDSSDERERLIDVPGTPLVLLYSVDRAAHQIKILEVQRTVLSPGG